MNPPSVAVVIASAGRSELLAETLPITAKLDYPNYRLVLSVPDEDSLPRESMPSEVEYITGPKGVSRQRNSAISYLGDFVDYVFFFDDDSVPRADYLSAGVAALSENPTAMGLTGRLLFDGVASGTPCSVADAVQMLEGSLANPVPALGITHCSELYGNNFAVPGHILKSQQFDERLPLYGWLEDYDFSHRVGRFGPLLSVESAVAVHLGASSGGRTKNTRLGYSQAMNPYYLVRKGTMTRVEAVKHVGRPVLKNVLLSSFGSAVAARRARLRGNILAFRDIRSGTIRPERASELSD